MTRNIGSNDGRNMAAVILALAWPTMLEQLMQTAVQYIDTAMVGALGTQATAAVGSTSTISWLIISTLTALGVGFLSAIAKSCGAGDTDYARKASAQAAVVVLVSGIFFTVLTVSLSGVIPVWMRAAPNIRATASAYFCIIYLPMLPRTAIIIFGTVLRAAGDTKTPLKVGVTVNAVNVVLNTLLIYPTRTVTVLGHSFVMPGADWGVLGAAWASAAAFLVGGVAITAAVWRHPMISPKGESLRPDPGILKPCLKTAFPNMLQHFGTSLGYVAFAAMINALGEVAAAAHIIANTVESAFFIPGSGMQTAAATLTGNAYGARDAKRMKHLAAMFIPMVMGLMIFTGAGLFFSAPALMGLFSRSDEVISLGATVLRMVALSEPFYGFSIIMEGIFLGVGMTKRPFIYNIVGMWCIRIVGALICTQVLHLGLVAAWACMISHNLFVAFLFFLSYLRGSWNPLLKEGF